MEDISSSLLGRIAVAGGYLTDDQLHVCLHEQEIQQQEKREVLRLGEIMKKKGFISDSVLRDLLEVQRSLSSGLFGEIAVRLKMATPDQVEKALRIQGKAKEMGYATGPIGELMKEKGFITDADIERILKIQEEYTVTCSECSMKYNAWKLTPGQEINCAICGNLISFEPSFAPAGDDGSRADARGDIEEIQPEITGYRIIEKLGHGEDSILYKAVQQSKNREVTIQFMKGMSVRNAEYMQRLQDEARRAIALHHPSLKKIYAIGKYEEHPYIVSEFVESESLFSVIKREGSLPVLGATEIIIQVADALNSALQEGIVHGDIKPSLILMLDNGTVKISELGIAKKTRRDVVSVEERNRFITYYMAPEIIIGKNDPDISSDIYSLGTVYFHMLAGHPPYEGKSPKEIIISISAGPAAALANAPQIPPSVSSCIETMVAKVPQDRYAGYDLLLADLKKIREEVSDVPRIQKTTGGHRKKTTETGSMHRMRSGETSTGRHIEGSLAGARIAYRERDKATPAVILLRLLAVLITAGVLLILFILLREPLGLVDPSTEQKDTAETERQEAEKTEEEKDDTQTETEVEKKPEELSEDVKTQLALLVRRLVYDITEYAAVKKEIEAIRTTFGEHEEITEALKNIEDQRTNAADAQVEKAEKAIKDALASDKFKTAMETARKYIDMFYGLPQSKRIEELRLSISEKMAEYFISVREKVSKYSEEGKYIEALSFLSDVIKELPEGGLKEKAEQMKKEMEHALAVKHVEDESTEGAERLELILRTHRDILGSLSVFDADGAEKKLETFRSNPKGGEMKKAAEAISEEIRLTRDLKARIVDLVNRGVIKVRCKAPGSDEEITIKKADEDGITAGPVSLQWQLVEKDVRKKLVSSACDINNPTHLAQLAVFFLAAAEPKMAITWYARSGAKGYDTEKLAAVFPSQNDFEAEELYLKASALFKKGEQKNECLELLTKLQNEYSGSPAAVMHRKEIKRMTESLSREPEKEPEDDTPVPEPEPDTEKPDIPAKDTLKLKRLTLTFEEASDRACIHSEAGEWTIEQGVLVGSRKAGGGAGCMARILLTEPYYLSGRLKFRDTGSAVTLQLGETRIIADLTTGTLFFEDANKERKRRPFEFKANTWYEFKMSIDREKKKVSFSFGTQQSEGSCDIISNDVIFLSDQENTMYLDDLDMRMKERPERDVVP